MKSKKIMLTSTTIATIALATPIVVTSCTSLPKGDISKEEQVQLLNSEATKIAILDSWLISTFTAVYVDHIKPNLTDLEKEKIANTIKCYFDNLAWPTSTTGTLANGTQVDVADDTLFSTQEKQNFVDMFQGAYKFYINFKSKIKSPDVAITPDTYFIQKALEWQKNKYTPIIEITENGTPLSIGDFKPSIGYTGLNEKGQLIEKDYKILLLSRGTKVFQDVMKLLLTEMYFIHSTEDQIRRGTNFNKMSKNPVNVNGINVMSYVGKDSSGKDDFSQFLFKKYLVENSPKFKWSYTADDYTPSWLIPNIVKTQLDFNNIKTTKESTISTILAPSSTELEKNSITNLQAFINLETSTSASTRENGNTTISTGDLADDLYSIKTFGAPKIGLYDDTTNSLFSFTEIEAINAAINYNNANQSAQQLLIPSINVKKDITSGSAFISFSDLDISWAGEQSTSFDELTQTFVFDKSGIKQELIINSIAYKPINEEKKEIIISFTYKYTLQGQEARSFDYSFTIKDWNNTESSQSNVFNKPYTFSGEEKGIKIFDETGASKGITYYMRLLPLFKKEGQILINKEWYMTGKFTFEGTPWNNVDDMKKIIYFLSLSSTTIYTLVQDFYLFNDYNFEGSIPEIKSQIYSLGLDKKTDEDRRNQGII